MAFFDNFDFSQHENVVFGYDKTTGLKAIIAVHDTTLGPALGGCRMYPYANDEQALTDVLRLSQGMTYKSALAKLPLGGGKSVIIGDPQQHKSPELLRSMGEFINRLGGRYIAAQDSGIDVADLQTIARETEYVAGVDTALDDQHRVRSGDPSPATAYGVFVGIKAAVKHKLGSDNLNGIRVAVQGVGNVGFALAKHLDAAGASLLVSDVNQANVDRVVNSCAAKAVDNSEIHSLDVDVYAPCALGGAINQGTVEDIVAPIIAGCANNQLAREEYGQVLQQKGILYAPDFVISAGGIIHIHFMRQGQSWQTATEHVEGIKQTLEQIFVRADKQSLATSVVANELAKERIAAHAKTSMKV